MISVRLRQRDLAPGRERLLRGGDGLADLLDRGEIDLAGLHPERRVVDGAAAARLAGDALAADPVADPAHFRRLLGRSLCDLCHELSLARR